MTSAADTGAAMAAAVFDIVNPHCTASKTGRSCLLYCDITKDSFLACFPTLHASLMHRNSCDVCGSCTTSHREKGRISNTPCLKMISWGLNTIIKLHFPSCRASPRIRFGPRGSLTHGLDNRQQCTAALPLPSLSTTWFDIRARRVQVLESCRRGCCAGAQVQSFGKGHTVDTRHPVLEVDLCTDHDHAAVLLL